MIQALQDRVVRNQEWRKDLVKRYWINNSDSEEESRLENDGGIIASDQDSSLMFEHPGGFKDAFFPVKVCRQKKIVNIRDESTFMYDVQEELPEHLKLVKKEQEEVNYDKMRPKNDRNFYKVSFGS